MPKQQTCKPQPRSLAAAELSPERMQAAIRAAVLKARLMRAARRNAVARPK
jgi:hypothetical protein